MVARSAQAARPGGPGATCAGRRAQALRGRRHCGPVKDDVLLGHTEGRPGARHRKLASGWRRPDLPLQRDRSWDAVELLWRVGLVWGEEHRTFLRRRPIAAGKIRGHPSVAEAHTQAQNAVRQRLRALMLFEPPPHRRDRTSRMAVTMICSEDASAPTRNATLPRASTRQQTLAAQPHRPAYNLPTPGPNCSPRRLHQAGGGGGGGSRYSSTTAVCHRSASNDAQASRTDASQRSRNRPLRRSRLRP